MGTRLVIWEDWTGRQIVIPEASLTLYYNPRVARMTTLLKDAMGSGTGICR